MDDLKEKVNTIIPIIDNVKSYFTEITSLIHDDSKIRTLLSSIETLNGLRSKLLDRLTVKFESDIEYDKKATLIFQMFEIIKRYENVIRQVEEFLSNTSFTLDLFSSNVTRTKGNEMLKNGMVLLKDLLSHNKTFKLDGVIAYFIDQLSNPQLKDLDMLSKLFEKYPSCIELYGQLLQTLINKNKDFLYPILDQIEYHKSRVIEHPVDQQIKLGQRVFKCFNLVPNSPPSKVSTTQLEKKHNVIILYKLTPTITVIDNWKDWKTTPSIVSKELIEAGKTLTIITQEQAKQSKQSKQAKFTADIHEHKTSDTWVVLDTFDGENFRFLKPWINDSYVLRENHIRGLLVYLGQIKQSPQIYQTRTTNINLIQQDKILIESKISPIDVEGLAHKVEHDVDAPKLKQTINTKMLKIPHKSTVDLLNNPKLIEVLVDCVKPPKDLNTNPETHMTYIIELGLLKRRFIKSVFNKFALIGDITCIRAALDDVITNASNIHRSILFKKELLKSIRDI